MSRIQLAGLDALSSLDTAGAYMVTSDASGVPILTVTSHFGITPNGVPYYDSAGAAPGEAAALSVDPVTGLPVLTLLGVQ